MKSDNIPDKWHVDEKGNSLQFRGFDLVVRLAGSEREARFIVYHALSMGEAALAAHSRKWSDNTKINGRDQKALTHVIQKAYKEKGITAKVTFTDI